MARLTPIRANTGQTYKICEMFSWRIHSRESIRANQNLFLFALANRGATK